VVATVGVVTLLLGSTLSLAGLPAPAEVVQGAPESSAAPSVEPREPNTDPVAHVARQTAPRRAGDTLASCEHGPRGTVPAAVAYHGPRDEKVVALTFDDGWGGRNLRRILRTLVEKHVNATFFPVGQAVRHDPDTWRKVARAGYPIADHTFDHGTLKGQCYLAQLRELTRARATYMELLDVEPLSVMRPPGGLFDAATRAAATSAREQAIVLWDVDSHDWTGIGARQIRRNALAGTRGSIIVLHTSSSSTLRALPGIIRGYRQRGFELVTIGQLLGIEGSIPFPSGDGAD
jgi:peptidoglycan/xylan/chitin deacetylase (PgdA/CDA1 family)